MEPGQPSVMDPISMGTTLVALEYADGVVIGADSRTSSGTYIANRVTDKLARVTDQIYCCRAGSAADTQTVVDVVSYHLGFYEMEMGEPATVKTAANVFRDLSYNYRDQMSVSFICAGWDAKNGGQVYSIPMGGMLMRRPVSIQGSGSSFIYGLMDSEYKPGMTKEECMDLVLKAVSLAIKRDGSSGGVCRMAVITKDGVEKTLFPNQKLLQF